MFGPEYLKDLVRFEVDPVLFKYYDEDSDYYNEKNYSGTYKPTYQDLKVACKNMLKAGIGIDTLTNWYHLVSEDLTDHYDKVFLQKPNLDYLWPNNDQDTFKAMDNALNDLFMCDYYYDLCDSFNDGLEEVIRIADYYEYNKEHETIDWKFTKWQRQTILFTFYKETSKVPKSKQELFKRIVDEECENGNYLAMHIKGYGCYGGDKVFDCDWEESRKWITKLFEKDGNPYFANSLGYIYYYGRCNNRVPEYEKAFQYFSVGAAHDLYESMYKIADMFLGGKGCLKSPETSEHIISKLYQNSKPSFCMGSDASFADIALRWASYWQRSERYPEALYHYLEADYAIRKRLKKSNFFGNKKVQESITKGIEDVKAKLEPGYFQEKEVTRNPYWLFDMVDDNSKTKFEINHLDGNKYRIKATRSKSKHVGKALIVAPRLECATLTRSFESEFITDEPILFECKDKTKMFVDNIRYSSENEYDFCKGDTTVFSIKNADYILQKSDFEKVTEQKDR